jgi:hypothetical protein
MIARSDAGLAVQYGWFLRMSMFRPENGRVELSPCPRDPEATAEAYCMGTLSDPAEAVAFEEHYFGCLRCLAVVEATEQYVRTMQIAARRLRNEKPDRPRTAHG